ncbi:MAG: hypothetical protein EOO14_16800 [Chitinophagaceae bacterium]|nr:MAG: hypothetical protein EOO14_16800 [Chitinophagaceae bacterium]
MAAKPVILQNKACTATYTTRGGALVDFRLQPGGINPLQFRHREKSKGSKEVFFNGHFVCLGNWGDPSAGEATRGHVKHGDFNRLQWLSSQKERQALLSAYSTLEGLYMERNVALDENAAVLQVTETVQNLHTVGRLYNLVQHPTIAAPFLDGETIVDCNATKGFDYAFPQFSENICKTWPCANAFDGETINLSSPDRAYSSVFSFLVNPADEWGWVTAYSPAQQTLLGYVWRRSDYPWISHWLHFEGELIRYRGLEFGTTGLHKPINEIWGKGLVSLLGESTCRFIDTGDTHHRSYLSFLHPLPKGFQGVKQVEVKDNVLVLTEKNTDHTIKISHQFKTKYAIQQ